MGDVMIRQVTLAIASTLAFLLTMYRWIVIGSVLLSWVNPDPYNPIVRFIYSITEPLFDWVREHLPVVLGGLDLSPIVVFFAIGLIRQVLLPTLRDLLIPATPLVT